jgi:hypothetical protein
VGLPLSEIRRIIIGWIGQVILPPTVPKNLVERYQNEVVARL